MESKRVLGISLLLSCVLCFAETHEVTKCKNEMRSLVAAFTTNNLTSNGYPKHYPPSDDCMWVIQAGTTGDPYTTQIVATDFDLNNANDDCSGDHLEIFEGATLGTITKTETWCSTGPKVFTSTESVVLLKFHSTDSETPGKGFSIDYSLINTPELSCEKSQGNVPIGPSPVIATFKGEKNIPSCQWKIHEKNLNQNELLVFELVIPSNIDCSHGRFLLYEGDTTSGHVNFEYCSSDKPFSKMFLMSNVAILKFDHDGSTDPNGLTLKIYRRSKQLKTDNCDVPLSVTEEAPVFFSLPYVVNQNGKPCPVHLMASNPEQHLRVDVMGSSSAPASCGKNPLITAMDEDNMAVTPSCYRGKYPVYYIGSSTASVDQTTDDGAFLRVASLISSCNGHAQEFQASGDLSLKTKFPMTGEYKSLEQCSALINSISDSELVTLKITWHPPLDEMGYPVSDTGSCEGDFVNVYDGDSASAPLLFSSCKGSMDQRQNINTKVVSSQQRLFVVLDTDARISGPSVEIEFHTVPGGDSHCGEKKIIQVGPIPQILTSPKYPDPIPLNQRCLYDLVASDGEVIVVNVLESNMSPDCETMLMIYEGEYETGHDTDSAGSVCGKQIGTFTLHNQKASLLSFSDDEIGPGGWKIEVYSEKPGTEKSKEEGGGDAGTWLRGSLIVILINVIFVFLC